jgi:hypothetical protein
LATYQGVDVQTSYELYGPHERVLIATLMVIRFLCKYNNNLQGEIKLECFWRGEGDCELEVPCAYLIPYLYMYQLLALEASIGNEVSFCFENYNNKYRSRVSVDLNHSHSSQELNNLAVELWEGNKILSSGFIWKAANHVLPNFGDGNVRLGLGCTFQTHSDSCPLTYPVTHLEMDLNSSHKIQKITNYKQNKSNPANKTGSVQDK